MNMKFIILSFFLLFFQFFAWAEVSGSKTSNVVHIEHPEHIPHHPTSKDPTDQGSHDGIIYPRKKSKKGLLEND